MERKHVYHRSLFQQNDHNLDRYHDAHDDESFAREIVWIASMTMFQWWFTSVCLSVQMYDGQNLLDVPARNAGEYSRILLKTLFKPHELQFCLLPSQQSKRYAKSELDHERFGLLKGSFIALYLYH